MKISTVVQNYITSMVTKDSYNQDVSFWVPSLPRLWPCILSSQVLGLQDCALRQLFYPLYSDQTFLIKFRITCVCTVQNKGQNGLNDRTLLEGWICRGFKMATTIGNFRRSRDAGRDHFVINIKYYGAMLIIFVTCIVESTDTSFAVHLMCLL